MDEIKTQDQPNSADAGSEKTKPIWTERLWKFLQDFPLVLVAAIMQILWASVLLYLQHRFEERQQRNQNAFESQQQQYRQEFEVRQRKLQQEFELRQRQLTHEQARIDEKIRLRSRLNSLLMTTTTYRERYILTQFFLMLAVSTNDSEALNLHEKTVHELSQKAVIDYAEIEGLLSTAQLYFNLEAQEAMRSFRKAIAFNPIDYLRANREKDALAVLHSCVGNKLTLEQCTQKIEKLIPKEKTDRYRNLGVIVLDRMADDIAKELGLAVEYRK